jgi:hypothetical protein
MALRKLMDGKVHDVPAPKSLSQVQFEKLKASTQKQKEVLTRIVKSSNVMSPFK